MVSGSRGKSRSWKWTSMPAFAPGRVQPALGCARACSRRLRKNQIEDTAEERGLSTREVVEDVMLGQARTKELMTPAEVANLFVFSFSGHGKHLNGGDLLWDGGYTTTYE